MLRWEYQPQTPLEFWVCSSVPLTLLHGDLLKGRTGRWCPNCRNVVSWKSLPQAAWRLLFHAAATYLSSWSSHKTCSGQPLLQPIAPGGSVPWFAGGTGWPAWVCEVGWKVKWLVHRMVSNVPGKTLDPAHRPEFGTHWDMTVIISVVWSTSLKNLLVCRAFPWLDFKTIIPLSWETLWFPHALIRHHISGCFVLKTVVRNSLQRIFHGYKLWTLTEMTRWQSGCRITGNRKGDQAPLQFYKTKLTTTTTFLANVLIVILWPLFAFEPSLLSQP